MYIDNELDEAEEKLIEEHIKICTSCKDELEQWEDMLNRVNDLEELELPEGYHEELMLKLRSEADAISRAKARAKGARYFTMAAALGLIFVSLWGYTQGFFDNAVNDEMQPMATTAPEAWAGTFGVVMEENVGMEMLPSPAIARIDVGVAHEDMIASLPEVFVLDHGFEHTVSFYDEIVEIMLENPLNNGYERERFSLGGIYPLRHIRSDLYNVTNLDDFEQLILPQLFWLYVFDYDEISFASVIRPLDEENWEPAIDQFEPYERGFFEDSLRIYEEHGDINDLIVVVVGDTLLLVNGEHEVTPVYRDVDGREGVALLSGAGATRVIVGSGGEWITPTR